MGYNVSRALCQFTFDGENNEIDAETLVKTLSSLNTLVFASSESLYPDTKCNLKVTATESGSFVVGLMVVAQYVQNLLMPENITYAKNVVDFIKTSLEVKKFLSGEKPKNVEPSKECVTVQNNNGDVRQFNANTINFFNNPTFDRSISEIISTASNTPEIKGISFQDEEFLEPLKIKRSEFSDMMIPVVEERENPTITSESIETLYIKQPDVLGSSKWIFTGDRRVDAKISDKKWLHDYKLGLYPIVPRTQMRVRMAITVELDDAGMPIEHKATYDIIEVLEFIPPAPTGQIAF